MKIERGSVVISHYGGSRDRWGHTYRYRLQNGEWVRIGETVVSEDTALGDSHEVDRNLITARVVETTRKQGRTQQKLYTRKPEPLIPLR